MGLARWIFAFAGVYGLLALVPQYWLVEQIGRDFPPAVTHVEFFYGFLGVAITWQVLFLLIAREPVRYRPLMLVAILEKLSFGIPVVLLYRQGLVSTSILAGGLVDLLLGALFAVAWRRTK